MAFDENVYCDYDATSSKGKHGSSWKLCIFDATGANLLAISGQRGLTINRSAENIDVASKDNGGWAASIAGQKEWSIDVDGIYVMGDESHTELSKAFASSSPVCCKIIDVSDNNKPLYGGLASITDYPIEAPYDDTITYSLSLTGNGALTDLTLLDTENASKVTATPTA